MGELRRDPIIGRWVIVETDENSLPAADYEKEDHTCYQAAICQFCVGKEAQTPTEVDAIRFDGSPPNAPGWNARVIPNKFPALKIEGDLDKRGVGIYDMSNGVGAHEVVIETPEHNKNLADFSTEEVAWVIRLYQNRTMSLAQDRRFKYIMIFKNYGESAGTSVEHAHSQIIALPMIPKYVVDELEGARAYYDSRGRCIFCDMMQEEFAEKERIIVENESFLSFCPFVPRYPFENWIMPKEHNSDFATMGDKERFALADILKNVLSRMKKVLSDPAYNFYLHITPVNHEKEKGYHWHIEIVPKLTREAGFEWGTGFYVVRTSPSVAAKYLREAMEK